MKRFFKRSLICILVFLLISNFMSATIFNISYGAGVLETVGTVVDTIFTGIIGIVSLFVRAPLTALATAINTLLSGVANLGVGGAEAIDGFIDIFITPFHIFFNKIPILDVNFFEFEGVSDTVESFRTGVAGWYYTMRLIAMMALLVILMYIGIRMAISTIAQEKAMYKKMLVDWVTSIALLFLLHYIILFTFECNNALVAAIEKVVNSAGGDSFDLTHFYGALALQAVNPLEVVAGFTALIIYALFVGITFKFIFVYMKRMLTIGFLIIIAPLITITYSIDKIGDQKAQALNTWLKEFVYNVLIQPFHCIIFACFASVAMKVIGVGEMTWGDISIGGAILAYACIKFIDDGEKIVKNIFGFSKASSMGQLADGAAAAMVALKHGATAGAAIGTAAAKGKNFIHNNKDQLKTLASKMDGVNNVFAKVNKAGNLTKRGESAANRKAKKLAKNGNMTQEEAFEQVKGNMINKHQAFENKKHAAGRAVGNATDKIGDATGKLVSAVGAPISAVAAKVKKSRDAKEAKQKEEFANSKYAKSKYGGTLDPKSADFQEKFNAYKVRKKYADKMHASMNEDPNFEENFQRYTEKEQKKKQIVSSYAGSAQKYIQKNKQKIRATSVGILTGFIGMGAAGTAGFAAASKFGNGLVTGYMSNTNETLQAQMAALTQGIQAANPEIDLSTLAYTLNANNENDAYKEVSKELKDLLSKIEALSKTDRNNFEGEISKQIALDQPITPEFFDSMLDKYDVPEDKRDDTLDQMQAFAAKKLEVALAGKIATSIAAGSTLEQITNNMVTNNVTNVTNNNTTTVTNTDQTINEGVDPSQVQRAVQDAVSGIPQASGSGVSAQTVREVESKADQAQRTANQAKQETSKIVPPQNPPKNNN